MLQEFIVCIYCAGDESSGSKDVAFGIFSFYLEFVLSEDNCACLLSHVRSRILRSGESQIISCMCHLVGALALSVRICVL